MERPQKRGRLWYEADFDYTGGYRNSCRFLYSNDGLMFVTYDHYATFCAIDFGVEEEEESMSNFEKFVVRLEELLR